MPHRKLVSALLPLLALGALADADSTAPASSQSGDAHLAAISPACRSPEARQFDFWTGEWDVRVFNRSRQDGRMYEANRAVMRGYPILDGCAFIEHWEGPPTYGFSVRAFDPERGEWVLVLNWPQPDNAFFWTLEGEFTHGRGEFFFERQQDDQTVLNRYTFSDISDDSLRWESAVSRDDGLNWMTTGRFEFTRRDPRARGLTVGPTPAGGDGPKCTREQARRFDFLSGQWVGEVDPVMPAPAPESSPPIQRNPIIAAEVLLTAHPILDGCAVQEFLEVLDPRPGDGDEAAAGSEVGGTGRAGTAQGGPMAGSPGDWPFKRYSVRSWVPDRDEWVQYSIDNRDPVFRVATGRADGSEITLTATEADEEGALLRQRWLDVGEDAFRLVLERSGDGGATWDEVHTIRFRRRG